MLDKGSRSPDLGYAEDGSLPQIAVDREENLFFFFLSVFQRDSVWGPACALAPHVSPGSSHFGQGSLSRGLLYLYICYD